jgi:hypothetical protein
MRLTRTDDETFDNDAKACYDRIIPNLTSICAQRLDMKPINAKLHSVILQQAEYIQKVVQQHRGGPRVRPRPSEYGCSVRVISAVIVPLSEALNLQLHSIYHPRYSTQTKLLANLLQRTASRSLPTPG